jgi:hypothetical protein
MYVPGVTWEIGPYRLRAMGAFIQAEDGNRTPPPAGGQVALRGKKRAHNFLIGHDLYLWSPKGFLTGSANTPGSILVGTHFERNDLSCATPRCGPINGGQFHRGTYIVREWDLWYFIAPRMSIGGGVMWYDASNLTTTVQKNLGVNKNGRPGGGGNWTDGNINFRYQF